MNQKQILEALKKPFRPEDIEWKAQSASKKSGQLKILVVPYLDARAIQDRLDEACGLYWSTQFTQIEVPTGKGPKQGFSCTLSIKVDNEWVSKADGAEVSDIETIKGGHSNAFKRAAAQWGIGRYLYDLPTYWVPVQKNGQNNVYGNFKVNGNQEQITGYFNPPTLPKTALPEGFAYSNSQQQPSQENHIEEPQRNEAPNRDSSKNQSTKQRPSKGAEKKPKEHLIELLSSFEVPAKYIANLFNRAVEKKITIDEASEEDIKSLYKALIPVKKYLDYCAEQKLSIDESFDFAQIVLKEKIDEPMNMFFKMDNMLVNEAIKLIHADKMTQQPA